MQPLAVLIPYIAVSGCELIVEFRSWRVDMEIPLSPLRSFGPDTCHDGNFLMKSPHEGLLRDEYNLALEA